MQNNEHWQTNRTTLPPHHSCAAPAAARDDQARAAATTPPATRGQVASRRQCVRISSTPRQHAVVRSGHAPDVGLTEWTKVAQRAPASAQATTRVATRTPVTSPKKQLNTSPRPTTTPTNRAGTPTRLFTSPPHRPPPKNTSNASNHEPTPTPNKNDERPKTPPQTSKRPVVHSKAEVMAVCDDALRADQPLEAVLDAHQSMDVHPARLDDWAHHVEDQAHDVDGTLDTVHAQHATAATKATATGLQSNTRLVGSCT